MERCFIKTPTVDYLIIATGVTSLAVVVMFVALIAQLVICCLCLRRRDGLYDSVDLMGYSKVSTTGEQSDQIFSCAVK